MIDNAESLALERIELPLKLAQLKLEAELAVPKDHPDYDKIVDSIKNATSATALSNIVRNLKTNDNGEKLKLTVAQLTVAEAQLDYRTELAEVKKIKGFESVNENYFASISNIFPEMHRLQRAILAEAMVNDADMRAIVAASDIVEADLRAKKVLGGRDYRRGLDSIIETQDCQESPSVVWLKQHREDLRFAAINPTNFEEEAAMRERLRNGEVTLDEYVKYLKDATAPHYASLSEQLEKSLQLEQVFGESSPEDGIALINEQFSIDVLKLARENPTELTGRIRGQARQILDDAVASYNEANDPDLSLGDFKERARNPDFLKTLDDKTRAALMLHDGVTAGRDMQRIRSLIKTIHDSPHLAAELIANVEKNPDMVIDKLNGMGLLGTDQEGKAAQVLKDIFRGATPEQRRKLIKQLAEGNADGVVQSWESIVHNSSSELKKAYKKLDPDAIVDMDEQEKPKMCAMPAHVQAQVSAAGVLNLGQQPTNMSPVEVPSVIPGLPNIQANPSIVLPTSR